MTRSPDAAPPLAPAEREPGQEPAASHPPTSEPTLALEGIVKRWESKKPPVLDGVALTVEDRTTVLVSGRNGAGKTTLLRIAAGLITPDSGEVRLNGLHPERDRREFQKRLGYLSAGNTGLYARLKVDQHLAFWARLALVPRDRRAAAITRVIEAFQLGELRGRRVDRLSMGQRQRLRLALAFLHAPQVVLLDEPTTSLDEEGIGLLERMLAECRRHGASALVCAASGEHLGLTFHSEYVVGEGRLEAL